MSSPKRKFDFIAIICHGGGRTAMQNYLWQCGDTNFIRLQFGKSVKRLQKWIDSNPHQHLGLILDNSDKLLPMEIVHMVVPDFPLLLVCRDIIGYAKSVLNHDLRVWADNSAALPILPTTEVIRREDYIKFPADILAEQMQHWLSREYAQWHKVFAALRVFAGPVMAVDFTDFITPGAMPEIMRNIGITLFNDSAAWNRTAVSSPFYSNTNTIFHRLPKLQLRDVDSHFSCLLSPWPREFWVFMKRDAELLAGSYPPETIDWRIGEFNSDLGFYCDEQEIVASGLSKQEFVSRASILLSDAREKSKNYAEFLQQQPTYYRNQNEGVFDDYVREIHTRVVKADDLFAQVQVTPEQIIETIRSLGTPVLEQYREIIRSQAEELASVGLDVTNRWTHAKEVLGPDGFFRPLEQRSSHLRNLIRELEEKWGDSRRKLFQEEQRRHNLKASVSWRITKPLRWLGRLLHQARRA